MKESLIFDIGCHKGEDSDFYLKKGFRIIAVEANPALCGELKQKFSDQIADGHFVLVEKAIAEQAGEVEFFVNEKASIWGTIRAEMARRNESSGAKSTKIVVPAVTFASLVEQFGMPYYLKIDIEGADLLCLEGLLPFPERPRFISFEHDQEHLLALRVEMGLLKRLGYTKFQIIDQGSVQNQKPPYPAKEGVGLDNQIVSPGSSGLFGKELPGPWLSRSSTIARYLRIYVGNRLHGVAKRTPLLRRLARHYSGSWYDTHAAWNDQFVGS
jgi:FkbM family methyltransferase